MHGELQTGKGCIKNWVGKVSVRGAGIDACPIFLKLKNSHHPVYLYVEVPSEFQVMYNLKSARLYEQNIGRSARFSNAYFQNTFFE